LKRAVTALALFLAVALPAPASAGAFAESRWWVAAGGGWAWPPAELGFGDDVLGVNGWQSTAAAVAGLQLISGLAVEGRGSLLSTSSLENLELLHGELGLTYLVFRSRRFEPFVTSGFGGVRAKRDGGTDDTFAWSAGGGLLVRVIDRVGVRVDARRVSYRVNYLGEKAFRPQTELFAGLHFGFGGGRGAGEPSGGSR
jgi:hypothetical protein